MTETTVAVDELLLGDAAGDVMISQLGGVDGRVISEVVGDARLHVGQRVLLATYRHSDGRRYLVGMSLGAYEIVGSSAGPIFTGPVETSNVQLVQSIDASMIDRTGKISAAPGQRSVSVEVMRAAIVRERAFRDALRERGAAR
jgi:hypothetical protein